MSFHLQKLSREERLCNDNTVNVDSNDVCLQVEPNFGIILSLALASAEGICRKPQEGLRIK